MFTVLDAAAHDRAWSLQLWACPQTPSGADQIVGHLIAEAALPPIAEIADDTESFAVNARVKPPAGSDEHLIVLALVSRSAQSGEEIQDFAVYPQREYFFQPRLGGAVAYRVENDRVQLEVERVENPRFESNLSGTLALELWALPFAYEGGAFQGFPLAGVAFDAIGGNRFVADASFDLTFVAPPAGSWQLVLMLREWTPVGFVTRDFRNFNVPFLVESPAPAVALAPAPAAQPEAKIASAPVAPPAPKAAPAIAAAPAPAAKPEAKATPAVVAAPVPAKQPEAKAAAPVAAAPTPGATAEVKAAPAVAAVPAVVTKPTPAAPKSAQAPKAAEAVQGASINTATVDELAEVNGVSRTLAKAIVAGRPYRSFDDLLSVKGMGAKLLAKIAAGLRL
jgi:DNA uptake protein ComE-like DNA-binding protein